MNTNHEDNKGFLIYARIGMDLRKYDFWAALDNQ